MTRATDPFTPEPPRPHVVQVMVDAETNRWIEAKRGKGRHRLSRSEVGYRIFRAAMAAEAAMSEGGGAGATPAPDAAPDRRQGDRRVGPTGGRSPGDLAPAA